MNRTIRVSKTLTQECHVGITKVSLYYTVISQVTFYALLSIR